MRAHLRGKPEEPAEVIRYDGSPESLEAVVKFCGPSHVRLYGGAAVWGQPLVVPCYVVNPYRGGFLVLSEDEFRREGWEVTHG